MFDLSVPGWEIVARTVIVYGALLVGLRLAGKREIGQMTAFDLVVILLVANAVQNAMVGPDSSLIGGLIAAAALLGVNFVTADLRERVPWLRRAVEGNPTLLINNGQFVEEHLRREHIDREEVLMALREHGLDEPSAARMAVLEVDGSISVVPAAVKPIQTRRRIRQRKKN
ncbi:MAG: DUF421 domain-containing protein [Dehalococcoidia bacterium]